MNIGILLAAGESGRFGGKEKLFEELKGESVILHSLKFLEDSKFVDEILIVASASRKSRVQKLVKDEKFKKIRKVLTGGSTRYASVCNALENVSPRANFFVIHNAANPMATQKELAMCFARMKTDIAGAGVGRKINATTKRLKKGKDWEVECTVSRENLVEMETPQVVRAKDFIDAYKKYPPARFNFTDDLAVLEAAGKRAVVVEADPSNRKITVPQDLEVMRKLSGGFFVGIGEDSHKYSTEGNGCLILAGVKVKEMPKLEAQSDGDVVIHALCNAISSAIGGGSLGTYATKICELGIKNSEEYLRLVLDEMGQHGLKINNCAISIEAAKPKIDKLAPAMKKTLGALLKINKNKIGITATSGEKLTPFGKGEAIKCQAVVSLFY